MISIDNLGYAQRQRLRFIESVAYWEGGIDRPRVSKVFSVTPNHVTKDFRLYRAAFPDNLDYVLSERIYRPSPRFEPKMSNGKPEEYLSLLRSYAESHSTALMPVLGEGVSATALPAPVGRIEPEVLFAVTRAIKRHQGLLVTYQSLRTRDPAARVVWPRGLVFAGFRWHVRAYDEVTESYRDLVLSRVLSVKQRVDASTVEIPTDQDWHDEININVVPSGSLSVAQQKVVAKEYGMSQRQGWAWSVSIKRCLIPYFLRVHRFDLGPDQSYPIELSDPSIVEQYQFPTFG